MKLAIVAHSHELRRVNEGDELVPLRERVNTVCNEHFRRIDRFIGYALLGSAACVAKRTLAADCGLYLSSGIGPVASNTQAKEQLFRDHLLPKPFHFVNTLGAAAGHHVGRNHGLCGQNLFLTQRGDAFQAALLVAAADLELRIVSQALVGAVEECTLPLDEHRQRSSLAQDVQVGEGTHWMLLQAAQDSSSAVPLVVSRFSSDDQLAAHLRTRANGTGAWCFAHAASLERRKRWSELLAHAPRYEPELAFHDSRDAALMTHWLEQRDTPRLGFIGQLGRAGALCLEFGAR